MLSLFLSHILYNKLFFLLLGIQDQSHRSFPHSLGSIHDVIEWSHVSTLAFSTIFKGTCENT
jgi:hypothetical protein